VRKWSTRLTFAAFETLWADFRAKLESCCRHPFCLSGDCGDVGDMGSSSSFSPPAGSILKAPMTSRVWGREGRAGRTLVERGPGCMAMADPPADVGDGFRCEYIRPFAAWETRFG
jgi:hypothetical protein